MLFVKVVELPEGNGTVTVKVGVIAFPVYDWFVIFDDCDFTLEAVTAITLITFLNASAV